MYLRTLLHELLVLGQCQCCNHDLVPCLWGCRLTTITSIIRNSFLSLVKLLMMLLGFIKPKAHSQSSSICHCTRLVLFMSTKYHVVDCPDRSQGTLAKQHTKVQDGWSQVVCWGRTAQNWLGKLKLHHAHMRPLEAWARGLGEGEAACCVGRWMLVVKCCRLAIVMFLKT